MRNVKNLSLSVLILALACNTIVANTHYVYPGDSIQDAIDAAVDGDTVMVASGNYYENLTWELKSINLIGAGAGLTIVDADINQDGIPGPGQCLSIYNVPNTATVEGFTFTGGAGGLYISQNCRLTLTNNTITGNSTSYLGAVYIRGSSPIFTNNTISDNSAGGIYWYGETYGTLTGNTITGNSHRGVCLDYSSPTVTMNTFINNERSGLYLAGSSSTVTNNTFMGNSGDLGAAIRVYGLYNLWVSPVITNNLIIENNGGLGGGVFAGDWSTVEIINNTFVGNSGGLGGAIYLGRGAYHTIVNNIMVDNTSGLHGGAVFANAEPHMIETTYINYNDLWNNTYGQISGGAEDIIAEPMFVDPAAGDYHLQVDSPCIDAGDNSSVPSGIVTDFDGNPRIVNGIVDMGAFEALADPMVMLAQLKAYIQQQVALGNIDAEIETSLLAKVDAALSALDRGNPNNAKVAMNDLNALINQVEAQTGKKITADTAAEIIRLANEIIEELEGL